jgi:shikimate kinase
MYPQASTRLVRTPHHAKLVHVKSNVPVAVRGRPCRTSASGKGFGKDKPQNSHKPTEPAPHLPIDDAQLSPTEQRADQQNKEWLLLQERIEAVAESVIDALGGTSLYLVGMMGTGKSTVGRLLAQALKYCFFDCDTIIEQATGKTIPEIFAEEGEIGFRDVETQVLMELSPFKDCVIATGGGAVTRAENWGHLQGGVSIWLQGPPELLARRVVGDGTSNRPMLQPTESTEDTDPNDNNIASKDDDDGKEYQAALDKINGLLEQRASLYADADLHVSLVGSDGKPLLAADMVLRILQQLDERIKKDAKEREERKRFQVVNENLPETMKAVQSINPPADDPYLP